MPLLGFLKRFVTKGRALSSRSSSPSTSFAPSFVLEGLERREALSGAGVALVEPVAGLVESSDRGSSAAVVAPAASAIDSSALDALDAERVDALSADAWSDLATSARETVLTAVADRSVAVADAAEASLGSILDAFDDVIGEFVDALLGG